MKKFCIVGSLILLSFCFASCHRNSQEVWEDTKTCSRYVSKGLRSLLGSHSDPYGHAYAYNPDREDFFVLSDTDSYERSSFADFENSPSEESFALSPISPGDPGSPIPGIDGFQTPTGKLAELFSRIHFATDKYEVTSRENLETIQIIAKYLKEHPNLHIFVEGHADERGAAAYNLALGAKRANAVRTCLIQNGVNADQLFTISFGKEHPLAFGHDETAWHKNRRAEFKLYEKR